MCLRVFIVFFAVFVACLGTSFSNDAHAQRIKKLTQENVEKFILDTSAMTSNKNLDRDQFAIKAYLKKHIHEDARFKSNMTFTMPGMPPQERLMSFDKDDYIEHVEQGAESVDHYHSEIKIDKIKISKNKKSASVSSLMHETGTMEVPQMPGQRPEPVEIDGLSECFQVLELSKRGVIQMFSANCNTKMRFLKNE